MIQQLIEKDDVVLFMKGYKDQPMCGFSATVINILTILNIDFTAINVLDDDNVRQGVKDFTNWPTIPQLFIKGKFIGGCDILTEMYKSKEILSVLKDNGIAYKVNEE